MKKDVVMLVILLAGVLELSGADYIKELPGDSKVRQACKSCSDWLHHNSRWCNEEIGENIRTLGPRFWRRYEQRRKIRDKQGIEVREERLGQGNESERFVRQRLVERCNERVERVRGCENLNKIVMNPASRPIEIVWAIREILPEASSATVKEELRMIQKMLNQDE